MESYRKLQIQAKKIMTENSNISKINLNSTRQLLNDYVNLHSHITPLQTSIDTLGYQYYINNVNARFYDNISIDDQGDAIDKIKNIFIENNNMPNGTKIQIDIYLSNNGNDHIHKNNILTINNIDSFDINFSRSGETIYEYNIRSMNLKFLPPLEGGSGSNGKNNITTEEDLTNKRCIVQVKNDDNMCLIRSTLVSLYKITNNIDYNNIRCSDKALQTQITKEVCKDLKIDKTKMLKFEYCKLLVTYYSQKYNLFDLRIAIVGRSGELLYDTSGITNAGNINTLRIYILYLEDTTHFHALPNGPQGIKKGKYFCKICHLYTPTKNSHSCTSLKCNMCQADILKRGIRCEDCKQRICSNHEHVCGEVKRTYREIKLKDDQKKCDICYQIYKKDENHICYEKNVKIVINILIILQIMNVLFKNQKNVKL